MGIFLRASKHFNCHQNKNKVLLYLHDLKNFELLFI